MVSPLFDSAWGRAQKGDNATTWPLAFCLGGRWPPALSASGARHFIHSLHTTGALLAAACWCWTQSLHEPEVCCGPFKKRLFRIPQFLLLPQPPLFFTARSYGDLPPWHWNCGLGCLVWGWDPYPWGIPPNFYPPHAGAGPPVPHLRISAPFRVSLHLCPSYPSGRMWHL